MNKIIKKLQIPGYEMKVITKFRKNNVKKSENGIQLSLEIDIEQDRAEKAGNV